MDAEWMAALAAAIVGCLRSFALDQVIAPDGLSANSAGGSTASSQRCEADAAKSLGRECSGSRWADITVFDGKPAAREPAASISEAHERS